MIKMKLKTNNWNVVAKDCWIDAIFNHNYAIFLTLSTDNAVYSRVRCVIGFICMEEVFSSTTSDIKIYLFWNCQI